MDAMEIVLLDEAEWKGMPDFKRALCLARGGPEGHGKSPDAPIDPTVWGGMNTLEPPYAIRVVCLEHAPVELVDYVEPIGRVLTETDDEYAALTGSRVAVSLTNASLNRDRFQAEAFLDVTEARGLIPLVSEPWAQTNAGAPTVNPRVNIFS